MNLFRLNNATRYRFLYPLDCGVTESEINKLATVSLNVIRLQNNPILLMEMSACPQSFQGLRYTLILL